LVENIKSKKLKVLCIGAGAIGTYVGGSLAIAGHEVHFLDRPETLSKIKEYGINLVLPTGKFTIQPTYLWDSMSDAVFHTDFDFAILAVKSYDTDSVINNWEEIATKIPPVICFQNGVENEEKIRQVIGSQKTISGTITTAIGRIENGIVVEKLRGMGIENKNQLTEMILNELNGANLLAKGFQNPLEMKWSKLLTNVTTNASCAILNMTPQEIMKNPILFRIEIDQLREVLAVMKRLKIRVVDLPGTPVRLFAFIVGNLPYWLARILLNRSIAKGRGNKMPSFYLDLTSGRMKSEVDYLNGAVVRIGKSLGLQTRKNQVLNETLLKLTQKEIPLSEFDHQPKKYIQLFYPQIT